MSVEQLADRHFRVTGYAEVASLLTDRRARNDPAAVGGDAFGRAGSERRGVSMQMCDGEQHSRLRRVAAAALTQRRCDAPLDRMTSRAEVLLDDLVARGGGDLIAEVIMPLVADVICDVLGVPANDRGTIAGWSDASAMAEMELRASGGGALDDYMAALLDSKRREPADDFCTTLAGARAAGDLSEAEALGTAVLMVIAGYETTVSFVSMSALTLLLAPLLGRLLAAEPDQLPIAIEELLRYVTPTKHTWTRFVVEDITVGNTRIPAGSAVEIELFAANHDDQRFPNPHLLDPARGDDKHLAFGHGPHYCPGATLARRESRIILGALLPRLAGLTLATPVAELHWHQNRFSRRPHTLPVSASAET